jgi:hypothetical protein
VLYSNHSFVALSPGFHWRIDQTNSAREDNFCTKPFMLLRIDVHPGSFQHESSLEKRTTHYISVGTGDRWTLGRKNATVEIKDDKTLSREHMALFFVTTNATYADIQPAKDPDQIKACEADEWKICLVLENMGKLGTFRVVPDEKKQLPEDPPPPAKKGNGNDDSGATTTAADETDSQNVVVSQSSSPSSAARM